MKIIKQPKAQMHAGADSADAGASQGARRATEDAPASARPLSPSIDSEVVAVAVAVAKRRSIANADKRRIVLAAAACTKPGEIGALMRREGVYSSALATWRRQYVSSVRFVRKPAPSSFCRVKFTWANGQWTPSNAPFQHMHLR